MVRLARAVTLAAQVEATIAERINTGEFAPGDRVPTEHELAADLGVSRATVRTAVGALARRGLIVSHQGRGSFVTAAGSALSHTLTEARDLGEVLGRNGAEVTVRFDEASIEHANEEVAIALGLGEEDLVLRTAKTFLADGEPMIFIQCAIPVRLLGTTLANRCVKNPTQTEPLFDFLRVRTNASTEYQLSDVAAVTGAAAQYPGRPIPRHAAALQITETGYTADNTPIWWSRNWYPSSRSSASAMRFTLVRQRPRTL